MALWWFHVDLLEVAILGSDPLILIGRIALSLLLLQQEQRGHAQLMDGTMSL